MRKKLATKICAIVMTAAMVASMAGCGDDSGDNSQASTPGSSEAGDPGQESGGADNQESETTPLPVSGKLGSHSVSFFQA